MIDDVRPIDVTVARLGVQVFLGETRSSEILAEMEQLGWGRIWTVGTPRLYPGEPWAFDNGAYSYFLRGRPFDSESFLNRRRRAEALPSPAFAVCPDIVGEGQRSLEFSLGWRDQLGDDWPWYLAIQDGMDQEDVSSVLDRFDGLFLGGTTRFKSTAMIWCQLAHAHGKRFHYGRAATASRVQHAKLIGVDSLDTSFPLWTKDRLASFIRDFMLGPPQTELPIGAAAMRPHCFRAVLRERP